MIVKSPSREGLVITRAWAMPNSSTFSIPPIHRFIKYNKEGKVSVDPFARDSKICLVTNDIDTSFNTTYNLDALKFLKILESSSVDFLLFDPPYSTRQVSECYKKVGQTVSQHHTKSSYWGDLKEEISRVMSINSKVISFSWNSGGIGKSKGFHIEKILLVAHGGWHNDTICTLERKIR